MTGFDVDLGALERAQRDPGTHASALCNVFTLHPTSKVREGIAKAIVRRDQRELDFQDGVLGMDGRQYGQLMQLHYKMPRNLLTFVARLEAGAEHLNLGRFSGILVRWDDLYDLLAVELTDNDETKSGRWIVMDMGRYVAELQKQQRTRTWTSCCIS
jgi:hypothetical protein